MVELVVWVLLAAAVGCVSAVVVAGVWLWVYAVVRMCVWGVEWLEVRLHPERGPLRWPSGTPGR